MFKKSFGDNNAVLIRQSSVRNAKFLLISRVKILVQQAAKIAHSEPCDQRQNWIHSNLKFSDMIYSPDFDSVPKFCCSFTHPMTGGLYLRHQSRLFSTR